MRGDHAKGLRGLWELERELPGAPTVTSNTLLLPAWELLPTPPNTRASIPFRELPFASTLSPRGLQVEEDLLAAPGAGR